MSGQKFRKSVWVDEFNYLQMTPGQTVRVKYLQSDPSVSDFLVDEQDSFGDKIAAVVLFIFATIFVIGLAWKGSKELRRERVLLNGGEVVRTRAGIVSVMSHRGGKEMTLTYNISPGVSGTIALEVVFREPDRIPRPGDIIYLLVSPSSGEHFAALL